MELYYRKYGSGPPLFILHGLFGSSDNWATIAAKLAGRFTVYLPDLRNHGRSPHSGIHDYDSMSNDLLELASSLKLGHFFLAGHSMGGKAAMKFALKWPEKLDGLLVADISPFAAGIRNEEALSEHIRILRTIISMDLSAIDSRRDAEKQLSASLPEKETQLILKNLQRNPDNTFSWKLNALSLLKNIGKIMESVVPDIYDEHEISGFPVCFLKGAKSNYITEEDFVQIRKIFTSAYLIQIPDAGHWVHADNPEAVVNAFLGLPDSN